ncbi:hypothetical protein V502_08024 [Pseudogymnoascus sp. VKM F-4520 (FW-2644)]|nr:hypothetical protein V502_08024 [Pseudogymnoascus sp. VKM F-4520 (FW-2644)]
MPQYHHNLCLWRNAGSEEWLDDTIAFAGCYAETLTAAGPAPTGLTSEGSRTTELTATGRSGVAAGSPTPTSTDASNGGGSVGAEMEASNGWVRCCRGELRVGLPVPIPPSLRGSYTEPPATYKTYPLHPPMRMRCVGRNGGGRLGVGLCDAQSGIELLGEESSGADDAVDEALQ